MIMASSMNVDSSKVVLPMIRVPVARIEGIRTEREPTKFAKLCTLGSNAEKLHRMGEAPSWRDAVKLYRQAQETGSLPSIHARIDAYQLQVDAAHSNKAPVPIRDPGTFVKLVPHPPVTAKPKWQPAAIRAVMNSVMCRGRRVFTPVKPMPVDWKYIYDGVPVACVAARKELEQLTVQGEQSFQSPMKVSIHSMFVGKDKGVMGTFFSNSNQERVQATLGLNESVEYYQKVAETWKETVVSSGHAEGFFNRVQTAFGQVPNVKVTLNVQQYQSVMHPERLSAITLEELRDQDVEIRKASMGLPYYQHEKTEEEMMLILAKWSEDLFTTLCAGTTVQQLYDAGHGYLVVPVMQAKIEAMPVSDLSVKVRPYYVYNGATSLVLSKYVECIKRRFPHCFMPGFERSTDACGISLMSGGMHRLLVQLNEQAWLFGVCVKDYSDDVWVSVKIGNRVVLYSCDVSSMDMSVSAEDLAVQAGIDAAVLEPEVGVINNFYHQLAGPCVVTVEGQYYVKRTGVNSGIAGTTMIGHRKVLGVRYMLENIGRYSKDGIGTTSEQVGRTIISCFADLGMLVKPENMTFSELSVDGNFIQSSLETPILGYMPEWMSGKFVARPDLVRLAARLGLPKRNIRDTSERRKYTLERIIGLVVAGLYYEPGIYDVVCNVYRCLRPELFTIGDQDTMDVPEWVGDPFRSDVAVHIIKEEDGVRTFVPSLPDRAVWSSLWSGDPVPLPPKLRGLPGMAVEAALEDAQLPTLVLPVDVVVPESAVIVQPTVAVMTAPISKDLGSGVGRPKQLVTSTVAKAAQQRANKREKSAALLHKGLHVTKAGRKGTRLSNVERFVAEYDEEVDEDIFSEVIGDPRVKSPELEIDEQIESEVWHGKQERKIETFIRGAEMMHMDEPD